MDLFDLVATLTLDTSQYDKGLDAAEKRAKGMASNFSPAKKNVNEFGQEAEAAGQKTRVLGDNVKKFGKLAVVGIGAASTAIGYLSKKSVDAYKDYEQLSGGVRKLFGDEASAEVMKFANEAYKTSGMSANQYMEQATSFSAALINSLNGDFSAAAKQTDVAMKAISDNFNTFGGDITSVQNAFQGFAKQQYNMLDNLKLGYGGTKSEMQRLIDDANKWAVENGKAADLSIDSFSDVVTAIDYIQQKQGIAGTTAAEAAKTIEGSLNMTKAAWDNLVAGFANPDADMGQLMDNLIVAIVGDKEGEGLLNQLIPAVQRAVEGIGKFIQAAVPMLAQQMPALIQSFLPVVIQSIVTLVTSIIQALPAIVTTLVDMMPEIIGMVVSGLVNAISAAVPILISEAPKIITAIITGLMSALGTLLGAAATLINSLSDAIKSRLSTAASNALSYAKKIPQKIKDGLGSLVSVGSNLIEGLWSGIKAKFDSVIERVKALAAKLPQAVKKVLGIASPSKVFRDQIGKNIALGVAVGIENSTGEVEDAMDAMNDKLSLAEIEPKVDFDIGTIKDKLLAVDFEPTLDIDVGAIKDKLSAIDIEPKIHIDADTIYDSLSLKDLEPKLSLAVDATMTTEKPTKEEVEENNTATFNYTFNVYSTPQQSPRELAEQIRRMIIREEKRRKVAWV